MTMETPIWDDMGLPVHQGMVSMSHNIDITQLGDVSKKECVLVMETTNPPKKRDIYQPLRCELYGIIWDAHGEINHKWDHIGLIYTSLMEVIDVSMGKSSIQWDTANGNFNGIL